MVKQQSSWSSNSPQYAEYLRLAQARGKARRAAFEVVPDPRERDFKLYLHGANMESKDRVTPPMSNPASSWGMETFELRADDGESISIKPPRKGPVSRSISQDPFGEESDSSSEGFDDYLRRTVELGLATGSSELEFLGGSESVPKSPKSLADALVEKIMKMDSQKQLSLLEALQFSRIAKTIDIPSLTSRPIRNSLLPQGKQLTVVLRSNWGDPAFVGLHAIEIFDNKMRPVVIEKVTPPSAAGIFSGDGWVTLFSEKDIPPKISIFFKYPTEIAKLNFRNFRSTRNFLNRGVKAVEIFVDGKPVAHKELQKTSLIFAESDEPGDDQCIIFP